jgi:hypothetical protein
MTAPVRVFAFLLVALLIGLAGAPPVEGRKVSMSDSLSTTGLRNEALIVQIYRGKFASIDLEREDMRFSVLYKAYLDSYSRQCRAHLPSDKVEMTRQVCNRERVTKNGWGVEISRSCVGWETVGTGLYADPNMYEAKRELDLLQASGAFRNVIGMLSADDPLANTMSLVGEATVLREDMAKLLRMNACDSPGLRRFQENLRLFALSKRPAGAAAASATVSPPSGSQFEDQNYTKLIEDLVYDQSKSWIMNRYLRGSISNVSVSSRDARGRPVKVTAQYLYNGFSGRSRGSVTLTFDEGWPKCLYFFDNPAACRTPDRTIVAAYADGTYRD